MVSWHGVKGAEEHDPGVRLHGSEQEPRALEPTFAFGLVRDLESVFAGKRLHDQRPFAGIFGVSDGECEGVEAAGLGEDDLG